MSTFESPLSPHRQLIIFCDGASRGNPGSASAAFVVVNQHQHVVHQQGIFLGKQTNNVAEYQAVILALQWLAGDITTIQNYEITINLDSELLYKQITGKYKIKAAHLQPLMIKIQQLLIRLQNQGTMINFQHQLRRHNQLADQLANRVLDQAS